MYPAGITTGIASTQLNRTRNAVQEQQSKPQNNGVFWIGADGKVYVKGGSGTNAAGAADGNTASYWTSRGFSQIADPNAPSGGGGGGGGGGGTSLNTTGATAPVLDQAQINSLRSLLSNYDSLRDQGKQKAAITRDTRKREKEDEFNREKGKAEGKKRTTLQEFGAAKTETDLATANTLRNLLSSLSTMGLGGGQGLTRQILSAANQSNRKANMTQAKNTQEVDSAFNEYQGAWENDIKKVDDQYNYDVAEADKSWAQNRQNTLYKMGDVYRAGDRTGERDQALREGDSLNSIIAGSTFLNPSYTGTTREMATPELSDYTQDIARYDTSGVGGLTPVGEGSGAGNLAIKAVAVADKDLGVKKKNEADLGYGV